MFKKIIYISFLVFFATSCAGTYDSVKRGITGQKQSATDEFLIEKKDPLILPPDYESLPSPDERIAASEEISIFEENLEISVEENSSSSTDSVENSILKKIQSQ
tara:strand:- start:88 stop:399 length:312 start_codon:yes stop_codon:yes gene_type:complete